MTEDLPRDAYRSPKALSLLAITGLTFVALSDVAYALLGFGQIASPEISLDLDEEGMISIWHLLQGVVAILQFPLMLFTIVTFLLWINRVFKNLPALKAQYLEYTSGWAVGWWFIPFANLVKPFQVVREAWRESDPGFDPEMQFFGSKTGGAPLYMAVWWGFWILSNILTNISSRAFDSEAASGEALGYITVLEGITSLVAACLAIKVVREITVRQESRFVNVEMLEQFTAPAKPASAGYA